MSVDRDALDQQLALVADSSRWSKRPEVNLLATMLGADEHVITGVTGWLIESGKLAMRTWLIVATSERVLCLLKGRAVEVPLAAMKAAYTDARLGYHEVIIESGKDKLVVSGMPKESAVALSAALNGALAHRKQMLPRPAAAASMPQDVDLDMDDEPLPMLSDTFSTEAVTHAEFDAMAQQFKRMAAELENTRKRLTAVEDIIRRAAARSAAAKPQA